MKIVGPGIPGPGNAPAQTGDALTADKPNRRRFHRIFFDAPCRLHQGETSWPTEVADISLKGILLREPPQWDGDPSQPFEVVIQLSEQDAAIVMALTLKHHDAGSLGFVCQYIDLESASHLKRLVELNLGDPTMLSRELGALGGD